MSYRLNTWAQGFLLARYVPQFSRQLRRVPHLIFIVVPFTARPCDVLQGQLWRVLQLAHHCAMIAQNAAIATAAVHALRYDIGWDAWKFHYRDASHGHCLFFEAWLSAYNAHQSLAPGYGVFLHMRNMRSIFAFLAWSTTVILLSGVLVKTVKREKSVNQPVPGMCRLHRKLTSYAVR